MRRLSEAELEQARQVPILEVARLLGSQLKERGTGDWWGPCPIRGENQPSFHVRTETNRYQCFGKCGRGGDGIDLVRAVRGATFVEAVEAVLALGGGGSVRDGGEDPTNGTRPRNRSNDEIAHSIWEESLPITGTVAELYLRSRAITIPVPDSIRFVPSLLHKQSQHRYPALVSAITVWPSSQVQAIQRLYLTTDGEKAPVADSRMMLGLVKGGAIRLGEPSGTLILCEGLETGLSALQLLEADGWPVWACLSAGGLRSVVLPAEVETVLIFADNDPAGLEAAELAASRHRGDGRSVEIRKPETPGFDYNDELRDRLRNRP